MLKNIVTYFNLILEQHSFIEQTYEVCEVVSKGGNKVLVADLGNGEKKSIGNFDNYNGVSFFTQSSKTKSREVESIASPYDDIEQTYSLNLYLLIPPAALETNYTTDSDLLAITIGKNLRANEKVLKTNIKAKRIAVNISTDTANREEIQRDLNGIDIPLDWVCCKMELQVVGLFSSNCLNEVCDPLPLLSVGGGTDPINISANGDLVVSEAVEDTDLAVEFPDATSVSTTVVDDDIVVPYSQIVNQNGDPIEENVKAGEIITSGNPLEFSASSTEVAEDEATTFTIDTPINGAVYSWDFGDGSAAVLGSEATHSYAIVGIYSVEARVVGDDPYLGGGKLKTDYITVSSGAFSFSWELYFDGVNDGLVLDNAITISDGQAFYFWFKPGATLDIIWSNNTYGSFVQLFHATIVRLLAGGDKRFIGPAISLDELHLLGIQRVGTTTRIILDGVYFGDPLTQGDPTFSVFGSLAGQYLGTLRQTVHLGAVPSEAKWLETWNNGDGNHADIHDNIISAWEFDQGAGNTVQDTVGNNNITINGATWQAV